MGLARLLLWGPLDDHRRDDMLSGWTRLRSPEKPGYPVASPLDARKRNFMLSGFRGTRWNRFRSPGKPGYPVASPIPPSRILTSTCWWRVVDGWLPCGAECLWLLLITHKGVGSLFDVLLLRSDVSELRGKQYPSKKCLHNSW